MAEKDVIKSVRLRIEGRVQGVWYRGWTVDRANQYDLNGWVRNRLDGSVEAVFSGPPETIELMINDCYEGPAAARVTKIEETPSTPPEHPGFRQLSTC